MLEGISYIAGAELPCVIVNVMRGGPGLGSIQASQGDYFQATKGGGHGDYHAVVYAPASVQECYDFMQEAFDVADEYRTPVILLGRPAVLGQMMEPVEPRPVPKRPPVAKDWATTGRGPGEARRSAMVNSLYIEVEDLEELNNRLQARYREIERREVKAELYRTEGAEFILCAYGTVARACKSAIALLEKEGIKTGLVRPITLWPFPAEALYKAISAPAVRGVLTVEMSAGQLVEDVRLAARCVREVDLLGIPGSRVPTAEEIAGKVLQMKGGC